jgi:histidyl-tRNA synthetase
MKPSLPQGTRDFGPDVVRKRQYILNTIRTVFELYGFQPLETPAMENLDTLLGKYGDEGDKLIFKVLNNGLSDPKNSDKARTAFDNVIAGRNDKNLTERALKYDLTIPFARYVAMNHGSLVLPFKRYQVQPVWRADRPQRGRYREFYQCDADVVGSRSLLNEAEFIHIYHEVFMRLGLPAYELKINSRKILAALAERCGGAAQMIPITVAIDKLDKIGLEKVTDELTERGLTADQVATIRAYLTIDGTNGQKLEAIRTLFGPSEIGAAGIAEIENVLQLVTGIKHPTLDLTLARGLNYYTGLIFEVKAPPEVQMGSIGGGGRYDDLTGLFGVPDVPGAGISFGVDRIYDVLEELNLFPASVDAGSRALFFNLGDAESRAAWELLRKLRARGIPSEIFHEAVKMDKQFKYAEKKGIPYAVILGSRELSDRTVVVKKLATGEQRTIRWEELEDASGEWESE